MQQAAFKATYSDLKFVKTRKVAQIVFELPIEQADAFLQAFGSPNPASETWCAIARLTDDVKDNQDEKPAKKWDSLRLSQQAAIRCSDELFQHFMIVRNDEEAAEQVKKSCEITSRAELDTDEEAAGRWMQIDKAFQDWKKAKHL